MHRSDNGGDGDDVDTNRFHIVRIMFIIFIIAECVDTFKARQRY